MECPTPFRASIGVMSSRVYNVILVVIVSVVAFFATASPSFASSTDEMVSALVETGSWSQPSTVTDADMDSLTSAFPDEYVVVVTSPATTSATDLFALVRGVAPEGNARDGLVLVEKGDNSYTLTTTSSPTPTTFSSVGDIVSSGSAMMTTPPTAPTSSASGLVAVAIGVGVLLLVASAVVIVVCVRSMSKKE